MTDTKIQRLRGIADWMSLLGWTNMATNVREAADELERLGKIEAAALQWLRAVGPTAANAECDNLAETLEANPCPTK